MALDSAGGTPQLRRLFLDPVALAAWICARKYASALPRPPQDLKAGRVAAFWRSVASEAFKVLATQLPQSEDAIGVRSLSDLCEAEAQRLYITSIPLVATYAKGEIASSSLHLSAWERLLGCGEPVRATPSRAAAATAPASSALPSDVRALARADLDDGFAEGDLDETGLIARLRLIMNGVPSVNYLDR
ncbi:MAG: hypothetical protein EPN37_18965 [Chitinophagaceae bacterium]|nr:MAG: hypothetical protein EPN37_18965 [Chitinophagaceae bacterium]